MPIVTKDLLTAMSDLLQTIQKSPRGGIGAFTEYHPMLSIAGVDDLARRVRDQLFLDKDEDAEDKRRRELLEAVDTLQAGPLAGMPLFVAGDWSGYETCTVCAGLVRYDVREKHFLECQAAFLADEIPATNL